MAQARRRVLLVGAPGFLAVPLILAAPTPDSASRVAADVARLASDHWQGRQAGSKGADAAAEWIAAEFRRIGLRPGAGDSYLQSFTFVNAAEQGPNNRLETGAKARLTAGADFRPLGFSASGTAGGEAVFAGYGIVAPDLGRDDYAGIDAKDRMVVVLRHGPDSDDPHSKWAPFGGLRAKATAAREKGARGILIVTGPRTRGAKDELAPLRVEPSAADVGIPAMSVLRAAVEGLFAATGKTLDALQALADEGKPVSRSLGSTVTMRADVVLRRASTRNVLGRLDAPGASEFVVIGAHYDHLGLGMRGSLETSAPGKIHHGADDNASGVSALLELARRLQVNRAGLGRNVLFASFGAEELGLLGSSHFVRNPPMPFDQVKAMINMDMIGRLRENELSVHGVGSSPVWKNLVEQAGRSAGLKLWQHEGGFGPSDHTPFYSAGKPVLFVFTGSHGDYHRSSDTADKVNAPGIVKVVDLLEPVIRHVASTGTEVTFVRVSGDKEQPAGGARTFKVWVGGVPDYGAPGPGVTFSGVSPGSPAEKGGLRAGDVLVKFAGKEIRDIYEYTAALGVAKPGDTVTLVVKRGGAETPLEVTLAERPNSGR